MTPLRTMPCNILLVDGTCVFCNRLVAMVLRHDSKALFGFSHIQSKFGRAILEKHGVDPTDIDGVFLVVDAGTDSERLLVDGVAGREVWPRLFRIAYLMRLVPIPILNLGYRLFARVRYRLFGRYETCVVPTGPERARFLE